MIEGFELGRQLRVQNLADNFRIARDPPGIGASSEWIF